MSHPFYRLTEPVTWATHVDTVSFSSLRALERCPLQWQLRRSAWQGFSRFPTRPQPAALEGSLVHDMLDRLFREMAFAGFPAVGSAEFRAVLQRVDVVREIQAQLDATHAALATHPRGAAARLPHDARTLYNRVAQLFQREYATVERGDIVGAPRAAGAPRGDGDPLRHLMGFGVLTEWPVAHPTLPVRGVVDMIRRDARGTHLVDFKTGHTRPEYEEQLSLYALLWWRTTGDLAATLSLRHPRGATTYDVDAARLVALEQQLSSRIERVREEIGRTPAQALVGKDCSYCDVRPFCDAYWTARAQTPGAESRWVDVEVSVPDEVGAHGFVAAQGKRQLPVVWDDDGIALHGPFVTGERLRIVRAEQRDGSVRLTSGTEVFHRAD